jgi:DNA-binding MarR family transcriptional regulator
MEGAVEPAEARVGGRIAHFFGERAHGWTAEQAMAFLGLREAERALSRELEGVLDAEHGLSISALGVLGQLAACDERKAQLSTLAEDSGLSISRISRLVDALEERGLVERRPCPGDARATNAHLTATGLSFVGDAQRDLFAAIQERFFDRLTDEQVEALAASFAALLDGGLGVACDGDE